MMLYKFYVTREPSEGNEDLKKWLSLSIFTLDLRSSVKVTGKCDRILGMS